MNGKWKARRNHNNVRYKSRNQNDYFTIVCPPVLFIPALPSEKVKWWSEKRGEKGRQVWVTEITATTTNKLFRYVYAFMNIKPFKSLPFIPCFYFNVCFLLLLFFFFNFSYRLQLFLWCHNFFFFFWSSTFYVFVCGIAYLCTSFLFFFLLFILLLLTRFSFLSTIIVCIMNFFFFCILYNEGLSLFRNRNDVRKLERK